VQFENIKLSSVWKKLEEECFQQLYGPFSLLPYDMQPDRMTTELYHYQ
jgi:hypothetical protein